MFNLREYQARPTQLSDLLPWGFLVAPGVVANKDGSFQTTLIYRGPDLDSATHSELMITVGRLNNALKRFTAGWALFAEARRFLTNEYSDSQWPNQVAYLLDQERRAMFQSDMHYESEYYLTFCYIPPEDSSGKFKNAFIDSPHSQQDIDYKAHLEYFRATVRQSADLIQSVVPMMRPLDDEDTLTYLHSTISPKRHRVRVPDVPMYLDALLPDSPLQTGFEPMLGAAHLRVITIKGFPGRSTPEILDALNRLAIEYRWTTRFLWLDKQDALKQLSRYRQRWFSKRKGIATLLKETFTGAESVMQDNDAVNKATDADAAMQVLADGLVAYGHFTAAIVVWDADYQRAQAKAESVSTTINNIGLTTVIESANSVEAWLGTLPGQCYANVRQPLLHTLNLAHLFPISAVWAGNRQNEHLGGAPHVYTVTSGSTPFRLNLNIGDVGHTFIAGPTGAGKDVLMALLNIQWLRYPDAQVYIFDKGGSSLVPTTAMGGGYYDLLGEHNTLHFQPLANIDRDGERGWCHEWVLGLLVQENIEITPPIKQELWVAINSLANAPKEQRTLYGLSALVQNFTIRQALEPYTINGALGALLDGKEDSLSYGAWQAFEMEELMNRPAAVWPTLSYLFHRLEQRFDGTRPTLLVLNEAWLFMSHPLFSPKLYEWLKVLRKNKVYVVIATQSPAEAASSPILHTILDSCKTRIYLPNSDALEEDMSKVYRRFGLNDRQMEILAHAVPKRQYYYSSPLGDRLFELQLEDLGRAFCAATGKEDQAMARQILATHGKAEFNAEYLRRKGLTWAADLLQGSAT